MELSWIFISSELKSKGYTYLIRTDDASESYKSVLI